MNRIFTVVVFILLIAGCKREGDWIRQESPVKDGIHYAYFLNDKMGWAITYGTGILLKTADAGETWKEIHRFDSLYYERIHFVDQNTGWICGEKNRIMKTDDGGITWEDRNVSIDGYRFFFYSMYFKSKEEGYIGGAQVDAQYNRTHVILHTTNGGKSWAKYDNNPPIFPIDIEYLNRNHGFICGENKIFFTTDGGTTWQEVYSEDLFREGFRDMYFFNEINGFAVNSRGDVLRSSDRGQTWSKKSLSQNRLRSIVFANSNEGFCVGDTSSATGNFFFTNNAGDSWEMITDTLPDLHCLVKTNNYIFVFGKEGTILRKGI